MNAWPPRNAASKTRSGAVTPGANDGIVRASLVNGPSSSCGRVAFGGSPWAARIVVALRVGRGHRARA